MEDVYGIDISAFGHEKILKADLAIEPIPFENDFLMASAHLISSNIFPV